MGLESIANKIFDVVGIDEHGTSAFCFMNGYELSLSGNHVLAGASYILGVALVCSTLNNSVKILGDYLKVKVDEEW